jgi:hypothetical protein
MEMCMKKNCWEVMKCGMQIHGENVKELGVCPASTCTKLDSVHGGKNAGRVCWLVAGSMCDGKPRGRFVSNCTNCKKCEFYLRVKEEEGANFMLTADLVKWLK